MRERPIDPELAKILRVLRAARGWNQAILARASGVPASSISQYENAKEEPSLHSLERIVEALGFPLTSLSTARSFLAILGLADDASVRTAQAWTLAEKIGRKTAEVVREVFAESEHGISNSPYAGRAGEDRKRMEALWIELGASAPAALGQALSVQVESFTDTRDSSR